MLETDARPPDDAGPHNQANCSRFASASISSHMADPVNLLVFRDTRERAPTDTLRRELCGGLAQITPGLILMKPWRLLSGPENWNAAWRIAIGLVVDACVR